LIYGLLDYVNLAGTLNSQGKYAEAIEACRLGLQMRRNVPHLSAQLARAMLGLELAEEAIAACDAALKLDSTCVDAYLELATARRITGDRTGARAAAREALALDPESEHAHCVLATLLLWDGELRDGLCEQEWHWRREAELLEERFNASKRWDGEPDPALRLLVAHEQGYGDLFYASRFLKRLRERVGGIVLECAPDAAGLMRDVGGVDEVAIKGDSLPPFDAYIRLMSIPAMFLDDPRPAEIPYLRMDPGHAATWQKRITKDHLNVGFAWSGNPAHTNDRDRSLPDGSASMLNEIGGVAWHSLHKGPELGTFTDTAAAIGALDLVISVDTAVAHLAGAMGKPVWLLLGARPDWRWMLDRSDTPWYPSMRLFRRAFGGKWDVVLRDVRRELETLIAS
jgi:hypothetical protein